MQTKVNKRKLVTVFGAIAFIAGYVGFIVGLINQQSVLIGISILLCFQAPIAIFFPHDRYYKQQEVEIIKHNYKRLEIEIRERFNDLLLNETIKAVEKINKENEESEFRGNPIC